MPEPLSSEMRDALADALLKCPIMADPESRNFVIGRLPDDIRNSAKRSAMASLDVGYLLDAALNYEDGLQKLIAEVRSLEGDSIPMGEVDRILAAVQQDRPPGAAPGGPGQEPGLPPQEPDPKPPFPHKSWMAAALVLLALVATGLALRFSGLPLRSWFEQSTPAPSFTLTPSPVAVQPAQTATPAQTLTRLGAKIERFVVDPTEAVPGQVVVITFEFENAEKAELLAVSSQDGAQRELFPIGGDEIPHDLLDQVLDYPTKATRYELVLKDAGDRVLARSAGRVNIIAPECKVKLTKELENLQVRSGPGTLYALVVSDSNDGVPVELPTGTVVIPSGYTPPTGLEQGGVAYTWLRVSFQTAEGLQEGWLAWSSLDCNVNYASLPLVPPNDWPTPPTSSVQVTSTATSSPTDANVLPSPSATPAAPLPPVVFGPYHVVSNNAAGCGVWERSFQLPDPRMVLDTSQAEGEGYSVVVQSEYPMGILGPGSIRQGGGLRPPGLTSRIGANGREEIQVTVIICPTAVDERTSPFGGSRIRWVDHVVSFDVRLFGRYP